MSSSPTYWKIASTTGLFESHVSDYESVYDALYEYSKNLEEEKARTIMFEFDYERNRILIYGDSRGADAQKLESMVNGVGLSMKGASHHGIGIMAFMRFGQRMYVFSKCVDGSRYVVSCENQNGQLISPTGPGRPVNSDDRDYKDVYGKLNKWEQGSVTVIEGVGRYKSAHHTVNFKMKDEFDAKEFVRWFRLKSPFSLKERSYFLKAGSGKATRMQSKLGHGKHCKFSIPSAKHSEETMGRSAVFKMNGNLYSLKVDFDFYAGTSNDGIIRISEAHQNAISIEGIKSPKIGRDSVFKNPEYTKYLQGLIDFKIKPLDSKEVINVYSGSRSTILMDSPFGDCLANILMYADREVLRPLLMNYQTKNKSRKDDMRTQALQFDMEAFFRENKALFDEVVHTKNVDPVAMAHYVKCPRCKLNVIPKRGMVFAALNTERNNIYAPEDVATYVCGNCGHRWDRRQYVKTDSTPSSGRSSGQGPSKPKPHYGRSETPVTQRQRRRGFGYSYIVCALDRNDTRRAALLGTTVRINRAHSTYKALEAEKNRDALAVYERQTAIASIVQHELAEEPKEKSEKLLLQCMLRVYEWYYTKRRKLSKAEALELRKKDEMGASVETLKKEWGAR